MSGFLPAFCLSIIAVAALNFVFVPPTFSFSVPSVLDVLELAGLLTVATVTTHLVSRATRAAREAEARARLLDLTHDAVIGFDLDRRITYWKKRLMLAVLERAADDLRTYANVPTGRGRRLFREVAAWFDSSETEPFDFEGICQATGLDPDFVRKCLRSG